MWTLILVLKYLLFYEHLYLHTSLQVHLLYDHNDQPGRKILISGGGRCNFTNRRVAASNYLSANPHFATSALKRFGPEAFLELVRRHKIAFHERDHGQLFCDDSARQIVDLLHELAHERNASVVVATHDERMSSHCDRVLHLIDGELQ